MSDFNFLMKIVETQKETAETICKLALVQQQIVQLQIEHNVILKMLSDRIEWLETIEKIREGKGYLS